MDCAWRTRSRGGQKEPILKKQTALPSNFELASLVVIPWGLCVTICYLFATAYHRSPLMVWTIVVAAFAVCAAQVRPEQHRQDSQSHSATVMSCLAGISGSSAFGFVAYAAFYSKYWASHDSHAYANVLPSEAAAGYADAGKLIFAEEARIDVSRAMGYKDGTVYCVAPILDDSDAGKIQFWAVGQDCCGPRGSFSCDDAWDQKAHAGMVLPQRSRQPQYALAVKQAEAAYGVKSASEPVFVSWVVDPERVELNYWRLGNGVLVGVCIVFLVLMGTVAITLTSNFKQYSERIGLV
eukprot:gb/GFBE01081476.1/.p1 GENE.gb/GFBE01081476.1/~~gb/GFBE01081476.1/.p1  ORF type:complete len:295 (+),score=50.75 gb/GFBE01081476.1/:1-885(+)